MHFVARLELRATELGGRRKPIASGFRASCWLGELAEDCDRVYNDAQFAWDESEWLQPGETATVTMRPFVARFWTSINEGSTIEVCEGHRVIGVALVLHRVSERWQNFNEEELSQIGAVLPALGVAAPAQRCPSCGEKSMRWYHYRNLHRAGSKISYVWCGACRRFYGQTTLQEHWDLPDPYATSTHQQRSALESDLDSFFGALDQLWSDGVLPQVR